ncbi:hypothetical protein CC85DRAFT_330146 [Cutaneotrichosporon oleaginosum]|uniref:Tubulin binding cofactor C-like domain-containing protein n=1 Tax=Cutaneotrichosporon oleaginosum TaxID=879819 RepID=A0A0J0XGL9_9TREE|nr:uncharacterized protein CC85DRAFT_330146 [Cutaneotrichosporon oleaginosum]KLT40172.1 hypothetical protein CC85DRAFT_330146 [Cutaneotrichosporon oleaginosum]TXT06863.1 hypothetical protein COLE_06194 [Cutaneotrichosporon oleaginosum]
MSTIMASTSDAAAFYATFQRLKADTADALSHNAPDAAPKLAALRAALAAARPTLPSYDQRSYDTQVRDLETKLAASRADKPKSRFAFKRAPPTGASASAPASASSSRAHSASPASPASPVPPSSAPTPTPTPTPPATTYTLSAHRNRTLTPSDYAGVGSYTLTLSDLADCVVDLRASPGLTSLHARDMRRCVLLAPIMAGSAMLSDMHECAVALGAQQFRLHDSADCALLLHTASMPVVERACKTLTG